jgi:hypothetical protein
MTLPNFVIIGVQKAGTTSIYNYLKQHPQIYTSPIKETHFFQQEWTNEEIEKAVRAYGANKPRTLEDYLKLFAGVRDEIAIGDASPNYLLYHQTSVPLIAKYIPHAKLIAILRNPVDRAYSDYLMNMREGRNKRDLIEQAKYRTQQSHVIRKGFYYEGLQHFYDVFDPQQIKVFLYDDLKADSGKLMKEMYQFLGVDPSFTPDTSKVAQKAQVPKNQAVNKLLQQKNPLRSSIAKMLRGVFSVKTRQKLRTQLVQLNMDKKGKIPPLSPQDRQELQEIYRPDILKLQELIGRDLSAWL